MTTLIVFDWDDTLLASTYLMERETQLTEVVTSPSSGPSSEPTDLSLLEKAVCHILTTAMLFGKVLIVTNADVEWVRNSAQKFMPAVVPIIEQLTVISAKHNYKHVSDSPFIWKFLTFQQLVDKDTHVISFGDSEAERHATKNVKTRLAKSVKLVASPTVVQLQNQLELIAKCFQTLLESKDNLDLFLTVK